jgi:hypothetical protein
MSLSTDWSTWAISRRKYISDLDKSTRQLQVIDAIASCLSGSQSAQTSATGIGNIYQNHHTQPFRECNHVWGTIASASRLVDQVSAQRLAELFIAIKGLPDLKNTAGYSTSIGGRFWRDTPNWGWIFREQGMDINHLDDDWSVDPKDADRDWRAQGPALLASTTFAAELLVRAESETYMEQYADEAMMSGVELSFDVGDLNSWREAEREWEVWTPAAATWIITAGEKLFELCCERKVSNRQEGKCWSEARWASLKENFGEMAEGVGINGDARCMEFAKKAKERMVGIELS